PPGWMESPSTKPKRPSRHRRVRPRRNPFPRLRGKYLRSGGWGQPRETASTRPFASLRRSFAGRLRQASPPSALRASSPASRGRGHASGGLLPVDRAVDDAARAAAGPDFAVVIHAQFDDGVVADFAALAD